MAEPTPKSPLVKMRLKAGMTALIYGTPTELGDLLALPDGVVSATERPVQPDAPSFSQLVSGADFVLTFALNQAQAVARLAEVEPALSAGAVVWIAYPKGSKAAGLDVSRDTIWTAANDIGSVLNANIAIDEKWSAVRLRTAKPGEL